MKKKTVAPTQSFLEEIDDSFYYTEIDSNSKSFVNVPSKELRDANVLRHHDPSTFSELKHVESTISDFDSSAYDLKVPLSPLGKLATSNMPEKNGRDFLDGSFAKSQSFLEYERSISKKDNVPYIPEHEYMNLDKEFGIINVLQLVDMGFQWQLATDGLRASGGNIEGAINYCLCQDNSNFVTLSEGSATSSQYLKEENNIVISSQINSINTSISIPEASTENEEEVNSNHSAQIIVGPKDYSVDKTNYTKWKSSNQPLHHTEDDKDVLVNIEVKKALIGAGSVAIDDVRPSSCDTGVEEIFQLGSVDLHTMHDIDVSNIDNVRDQDFVMKTSATPDTYNQHNVVENRLELPDHQRSAILREEPTPAPEVCECEETIESSGVQEEHEEIFLTTAVGDSQNSVDLSTAVFMTALDSVFEQSTTPEEMVHVVTMDLDSSNASSVNQICIATDGDGPAAEDCEDRENTVDSGRSLSVESDVSNEQSISEPEPQIDVSLSRTVVHTVEELSLGQSMGLSLSSSLSRQEMSTPSSLRASSRAENCPSSVLSLARRSTIPLVFRRKYLPYQITESESNKWKGVISLKQVNLKKSDQSPQGHRADHVSLGACSSREVCIDLCESIAPPTWVAKTPQSVCVLCTSPFRMFSKPHHCRNCGHIVCSDCSDKLWPSSMVPPTYHDNEKVVRVCHGCHLLLEQFIHALRNGNFEHLLEVVASGNVNLHSPLTVYQNFAYPIHLAASGGNFDLFRWLVEVRKCALFNRSSQRPLTTASGLTVLAVAAYQGHVDIINYLVHVKKCSISEITDAGILQRALHAALKANGPLPNLQLPKVPPKAVTDDLVFGPVSIQHDDSSLYLKPPLSVLLAKSVRFKTLSVASKNIVTSFLRAQRTVSSLPNEDVSNPQNSHSQPSLEHMDMPLIDSEQNSSINHAVEMASFAVAPDIRDMQVDAPNSAVPEDRRNDIIVTEVTLDSPQTHQNTSETSSDVAHELQSISHEGSTPLLYEARPLVMHRVVSIAMSEAVRAEVMGTSLEAYATDADIPVETQAFLSDDIIFTVGTSSVHRY